MCLAVPGKLVSIDGQDASEHAEGGPAGRGATGAESEQEHEATWRRIWSDASPRCWAR